MNKARKYLELIVTKFIKANPDYHSWILRHGIECGEQQEIKPGPKRMCFHNAFNLAVFSRKMIYCEGIAFNYAVGIATAHAWCIDRDGNVYDPTWHGDQADYFGVPLKTSFISRLAVQRGTSGPFVDDFEYRWPLVTGKYGPARNWKRVIRQKVNSES